jgi:hypothetical protein
VIGPVKGQLVPPDVGLRSDSDKAEVRKITKMKGSLLNAICSHSF